MPLPFIKAQSKKRDQLIAIDLGARSTKAIHLQNRGESWALLRYCVMDAPIFEKSFSADMLAEHLKAVVAALDAKTKFVSLAVGVNDSLVRQTEMPPIPVDDMRLVLKMNSKTYLQQELPNHVFDCYLIPAAAVIAKPAEPGKAASPQKLKVLVGGAKKQLIDDLQSAVRQAGLAADQLIPGLVCPANAFERAMPEAFRKEAVALVDIGFKSTSICLFNKGELVVTRVVNIGGDRLTQGLSEAMGISYAEAEGIKVGMPAEVESNLEPLLTPLGRELRASLDFFEHQQDHPVQHVYFSGGSARSEFIIKALETELVAPCKTWNPVANLELALPPAQNAELEHVGPQLTVAVGSAVAAF